MTAVLILLVLIWMCSATSKADFITCMQAGFSIYPSNSKCHVEAKDHIQYPHMHRKRGSVSTAKHKPHYSFFFKQRQKSKQLWVFAKWFLNLQIEI